MCQCSFICAHLAHKPARATPDLPGPQAVLPMQGVGLVVAMTGRRQGLVKAAEPTDAHVEGHVRTPSGARCQGFGLTARLDPRRARWPRNRRAAS